jgi:hypothetical protein
MATLTPILTATPNAPTTYNTGIAETFSWIPVANDGGRPIYARATYLTNASDMSVSLSANSLNINLEDVEALLKAQLGRNGFVFIKGGETATGNFTTVQVVSAAKISSIAATNSTVGTLSAFELPVNFTFNGPITSLTLSYGAALVYKL